MTLPNARLVLLNRIATVELLYGCFISVLGRLLEIIRILCSFYPFYINWYSNNILQLCAFEMGINIKMS